MKLPDHYPGGIWGVDFEFHPRAGREGNPPVPVCMVAKNFKTGESIRLWQNELESLTEAPFPTDESALMVAYYASAEIGCFGVLDWPMPVNVLDLYISFRMHTNGRELPSGSGLLGAQIYFGLQPIGEDEKDSMRRLVLDGGPWNAGEQNAILRYCESDVLALENLLEALHPHIDWPRALLHGRYPSAVARIELTGVPIDTPTFQLLLEQREAVQLQLIQRIDSEFGVFEGTTFKADRFEGYLKKNGLEWPSSEAGRLDLSESTFKDMCRVYPQIELLRQARKALATLRKSALQIGDDGRNRCLLSMYRSGTGRNQPSNSKSIFGQPSWMRGLIQPPPGFALAYVDWSQQEFGIAAALSGDSAMLKAYQSGDPYLAFAKQAGAVPACATKHSHGKEREQFKACVLAVQYGMAAESLAYRIGQPVARARQLLDLHKVTYCRFWEWSEGVLNQATLNRKLWTAYGWPLHVDNSPNGRSLRNFPMQANGSEMMRLACIRLTLDGIRVCAPVHDAILVEAPLGEIEGVVHHTQDVMARASAAVLGGFALSSDAKVMRYPSRFLEDRGRPMWNEVMDILGLHHLLYSPE